MWSLLMTGSVDRWFRAPANLGKMTFLVTISTLYPDIYIRAMSDSSHHIDSRAARDGCLFTISESIDELVVGHAVYDETETCSIFVNLVLLF